MPYWFDGNNLIGQSAARARLDGATRDAFLRALSEYAGARGLRFVVYFDGDDPEGRRAPNGVLVRYSAPRSSDDAIILRLQETQIPSDIIVVTNDHSLARRCRETGAAGIGWDEFLRRMSRPRTHRRTDKNGNDPTVDVGEWLEFFGLERDSLG